jgi:outer membrane protein OmpA-like peptidoglycan-associated protein
MKIIAIIFLLFNCVLLYANDTTGLNRRVLWKAGFSIFPSLYNHNVNFAALPGIPSCGPAYASGSGFMGSVGIDFQYNFENDPWSIQSRLDIKSIPGNFYQKEEILIDDPNAVPYYQLSVIGYNLRTGLQSIGLTFLANYQLDSRFSVGFGTRLGGFIRSSFDQYERLESPSNAVFLPEQSRTRNEYSGSIPQISTIEGALVFNTRYALPLNSLNTTQIIPEIGYELPMTRVVTGSEQWNYHTIRFGVTLAFSYVQEDEITIPIEIKTPIIIPQVTIKSPIKKQVEIKENLSSLLQAPIKVLLFDSTGKQVENQINIEKKVARNMFSIINYVFFDSGSVDIPKRYKTLSPEEQKNFDLDEIRSDSAITLYYNVLNILGKRLQNKPNAIINLTGTNSNNGVEKNNLDLSQKRAESIKDYLVKVWNIDPKRVQTESRNLPEQPSRVNTGYGEEENRRVEISASDPDIFLPVKFIDTSYKVLPNDIRISTSRLDKQNIKQWELRAIAGGQSVVIKTGGTVMEDTLRATANDISDNLLNSSKVELKIVTTDTEGNERVVGETEIPVNQIIANKNKVEKYNLITFGYNSSAVDEANNFIIQDVKKNISNSSVLTLTGHTDKTGTAQYNRTLSLRRAQEISRYFMANKIVTEGKGFDELLFPLELPEGRFYSRTVRITVDTYLDDEKE